MKGFWQLISLMISLGGFLVVAGVLLVRGEPLWSAAVRAVLVFVALWVVQGVLGALLSLAANSQTTDEQAHGDS